jgi:hypothetical protein
MAGHHPLEVVMMVRIHPPEPLRDRLVVGRLTLDQVTLVRIQVPQPKKHPFWVFFWLQRGIFTTACEILGFEECSKMHGTGISPKSYKKQPLIRVILKNFSNILCRISFWPFAWLPPGLI